MVCLGFRAVGRGAVMAADQPHGLLNAAPDPVLFALAGLVAIKFYHFAHQTGQLRNLGLQTQLFTQPHAMQRVFNLHSFPGAQFGQQFFWNIEIMLADATKRFAQSTNFGLTDDADMPNVIDKQKHCRPPESHAEHFWGDFANRPKNASQVKNKYF